MRNTLFQDVERDGGFVLVGYEWGREADGGFSAPENQQAALEGQLDDTITPLSGNFARGLILDDLDADHQAAPAYLAYDGVFCRPLPQAGEHLVAEFCSVGNAFAFEDIIGGRYGCAVQAKLGGQFAGWRKAAT